MSRRGWIGVAACGLMIGLTAWAIAQAGRFLEGPGGQPMPADFQVVLGGEIGDRVMKAARNHAGGFAAYVLVTGIEATPAPVRPAFLDWRIKFLVDAGVPLDHILFDTKSRNSFEEALNTRQLMQAKGWHRVLVISDPSHMRRLSWIWSRAFAGSGLEYSLVATEPEFWRPDGWWHDERSGATVIMEYIKIAYYLMKY